MNKRQKLVQQQFINNEEAVIKRLKSVYNQSLKDIESKAQELQNQINALDALQGTVEDPAELARLQSMKQAKVYQKQYQDALKKQVSGILDNMQVEEFKTVSEYLNKCYEDGFIGTMYDLHGQGIPLCFPMNQESMVRAVQLDSKISQGLYERLGEDIPLLKKKITAQVSRGISTGMSFEQVAKQLSGYTNIGYNNAIRIARTEGHRIQTQAGMDACYKAKDMGADVVKQWDSTLDSNTRESHAIVDGEIRELDKPFSNGLMFPGDPSGGASEVCNCRCALLQRARWELDESELETLQKRAEYFGLDKSDSFEDFKQKYLKAAEELTNNSKSGKIQAEKSEALKFLLDGIKANGKIESNPVKQLKNTLNDNEIISRLGGGDLTSGSCSSLALAYIGNKHGLDVLDFRGGDSCWFFSRGTNIRKILELPNIKGSITSVKKELAGALDVLKGLENGKEYYFCAGRHAAIVRKTEENALQYLELQSPTSNGWTSFNKYGSVSATLQKRFVCRKTEDKIKIGDTRMTFEKKIVLMDVDSFKGNDEFAELLSYINTQKDKQRVGKNGAIK